MSARKTVVVSDQWSVARRAATHYRSNHKICLTDHRPLTTDHSSAAAASRRRGVLLLVVLSMLILFVMIAVTYVLVSSRQYSSGKSYFQAARTNGAGVDPPPALCERALMQLLRGDFEDPSTHRFHSAIGPHSLLEDEYQSRPFVYNGPVQLNPNPPGGLVDLVLGPWSGGPPAELSALNDNVTGRVLTMINGNAKGLSTRVVNTILDQKGSDNPSQYQVHIRVLPFKSPSGQFVLPSTTQPGDQFIINSAPFAGTGFGFDWVDKNQNAQGLLDAKDRNDREYALLPNPIFYNPSGVYPNDPPVPTDTYRKSNANPTGVPFGGFGGAHEAYDAPDYQNMHMSWIIDGPSGQPPIVMLPSFHRPDLINYWLKRTRTDLGKNNWNFNDPATAEGHKDPITGVAIPDGQYLLERIMLRPNVLDHPSFTGSNPDLTGANFFANIAWSPSLNTPCPWDVDNDNDGVRDSVWLDLGFPIQSTADGRLYKPLVAILCVDLDGRINVNAHGTLEQLAVNGTTGQPYHSDQVPGAFAANFSTQNPTSLGANLKVILPRGQGHGPAEIELTQVVTLAEAKNLLQGAQLSGGIVEGRYGECITNSGSYSSANASAGHKPLPTDPSGTNSANPLALIKRFNFPDNRYDPAQPAVGVAVANVANTPSSFSSPSDLWGQTALGLDFRGQPLYWRPTWSQQPKYGWTNETLNSPYDINLTLGGPASVRGSQSADNPFTVFDLERLLRQHDVDVTALPRRLFDLMDQSIVSDPADPFKGLGRGRRITTDSWDPPVMATTAPRHLRTVLIGSPPASGAEGPSDFASMNLAKDFNAVLRSTSNEPTNMAVPAIPAGKFNQASFNYNARQQLPFDALQGLKMNLNRTLGDGRDGNGNGVVDEAMQTEIVTEGKPTDPNSVWKTSLYNNGNVPLNLSNGLDVNHDGKVDVFDQLLARHNLARNLFCLAMLMIDDQYLQNVQWFTQTGLTPDQKRELAIRRLAQWAVNVVDFMDPDNICTPFEYDVNPFVFDDTTNSPSLQYGSQKVNLAFEVDGMLDSRGISDPQSTDHQGTHPWRRLAWGCEAPALLITETLAFHDRRVADTKNDPSGKDRNDYNPNATPPQFKDNDLDQVRIPEGSVFIELYAPSPHLPVGSGGNTISNRTASRDLYIQDPASGEWYLDLAKLAPPGTDGLGHNASYPVWRLAISKPHVGTGATTPSPRVFGVQHPDSATFEPEQYVGDPNARGSYLSAMPGVADTDKVEIDRIVWFAGKPQGLKPDDTTHQNGDRTYYGQQYYNAYVPNTAYVPAGGYAVVGPREVTAIGSRNNSSQRWGDPSKQRIDLKTMALGPNIANGMKDANDASNYPTPGQIKQPVTIVAAANPPGPQSLPVNNWTNAATRAPNGIGVSISEPLPQQDYYPEPTAQNPLNPNASKWDAYDSLTTPLNTFRDTPLEQATGLGARPVEKLPTKTNTGTTKNYRTIFVQRLADPLSPYHPVTNPYLTVDWMPVDLTVFNGEDRQPANWDPAKGQWDPDDNNPNSDTNQSSGNLVRFGSRQRGRLSNYSATGGLNTNTDYNIWSQWPNPTGAGDPNFNLGGEDPKTTKEASLTGSNLPNFRHALQDSITPPATFQGACTLGFLNSSYGQPLGLAQLGRLTQLFNPRVYLGDPQSPFPWLTWNNRPFANPAEVMLVPAASSARLLLEFTVTPTGAGAAGINPYDDAQQPGGGLPFRGNARGPFGHLLNFFSSSLTAGKAPNLIQLLDCVQTPSPFVGTETVLNPNIFQMNSLTAAPIAGEPIPGDNPNGGELPGTTNLHTPFNKVSNYRDPGRVNVNTVASTDVWNAILGGNNQAVFPGPTFDQLIDSRRGYSIQSNNKYEFDSSGNFPSIFSNPFRAAAAADMVPMASLAQKPVNATLWRATGTKNGNPAIDASTVSLFDKTDTQPYKNTERNPYFRYLGLERAVNKLTTRSNVYAVWITVGYFEVTPWMGANASGVPNTTGPTVVDFAHPDGYQLGQELGIDTGEIERHRAFYIIDRTIPVGFVRGVDHNAANCVLLKRFIE